MVTRNLRVVPFRQRVWCWDVCKLWETSGFWLQKGDRIKLGPEKLRPLWLFCLNILCLMWNDYSVSSKMDLFNNYIIFLKTLEIKTWYFLEQSNVTTVCVCDSPQGRSTKYNKRSERDRMPMTLSFSSVITSLWTCNNNSVVLKLCVVNNIYYDYNLPTTKGRKHCWLCIY